MLLAFLSSCKKVETTRTYTVTDTTAQTTIASDEVTVNIEFDQAADDAVKVICTPKTSIAGALVDTSQLSSGIIIIDYFGKETDGTKSRTGSDSIQERVVNGHVIPWGTPGATATLTFGTASSPNYEVLFLNNGNASITFEGSATLTNIYGGLLQNVVQGDSVVEHVRANVSFTYNDNASMVQFFTWNLNQLRAFSVTDTNMFASTRGDTTIAGYTIGTWGTTRLGTRFFAVTNSPIVQNISASFLDYNPLNGAKTIEGISEPISLIYGVNQQGTPFKSGTIPYGFYISWVDNTVNATDVLPYYY